MEPSHTCDQLKEWCADPRSPIRWDVCSHNYIIECNKTTRLRLYYCPFCGVNLEGGSEANIGSEVACGHLQELSKAAEYSATICLLDQEYWLVGSHTLTIRLFYCPICGAELPLHENDKELFIDRAPEEVAHMKESLKHVTSIELAYEHLGAPDVERGLWTDNVYPKGQLAIIGYRRALFYNNIGKSVNVAAIEWLDGSFDLKFYPKTRGEAQNSSCE